MHMHKPGTTSNTIFEEEEEEEERNFFLRKKTRYARHLQIEIPKAKIDLFDNKERTRERERGRWTMTKRRACTSRLLLPDFERRKERKKGGREREREQRG